MNPKVTIAIDSFKGSLTSTEAAQALAEGIGALWPHCEVAIVPLADGGEGTAQVLVGALGGEWVEVATLDPLGRPLVARYGLCGTVAVMDVASAAGLTLLEADEQNPLKTSSAGVGIMIADALNRGAKRVLLGVGGSATNDCAMGLLELLGVRFLDTEGEVLQGCGESLERVAAISLESIDERLQGAQIEILADVGSPLCGAGGAALRFSPQKGATPEVAQRLDRGAKEFAAVVGRTTGRDMLTLEGGGAAGGIAGALWALLGAEVRSGADEVLEAVCFESCARGSAFIITGEGRIDGQTLTGKAPMGVLSRGQKMAIPVVAVGGSVEWSEELQSAGFERIVAATPEGVPLSEAIVPERAKAHLRRAGEMLAREYLPTMPYFAKN